MQVKILRPKFLSFPWSKWKNLSDHQVEKFLNNYMRITDELVFTQIYSILHLISIQKWKKRLNSKFKYRTWLFVIRSPLFEYSNIIHNFKKDRIRIRISLFGLLLFEYSNNELFVATLIWATVLKLSLCPIISSWELQIAFLGAFWGEIQFSET